MFISFVAAETTAANELARRFGCYVYHTDENRAKHFRNANPLIHTALCRDVPDYWALDLMRPAMGV